MFLYDFFCKKSVVDKISESKKRILKYDEYNKIDMRDLKDFQEIYAELDLTSEQRVFLDDYFALLQTIKEYNGTVSYFAGFFDALKIAKNREDK